MAVPQEGELRIYFPNEGFSKAEKISAESPVEHWANAEALIKNYDAGSVGVPNTRFYYEYPAGRRLVINNEQVMDTCEAPWAAATVENAFASEGIRNLPRPYKIRVLERGAGLNIAGSRIIQKMMGRGSGEYHVIELNKKVANEARRWKEIQMSQLNHYEQQQGLKLDIDIKIHEGDAVEVTKELVAQGIRERKKFNLIISDTFPITPKEKGMNDIADIETLKKGLYGGAEGVFTFFAYYPGWDSGESRDIQIRVKQQMLLDRHFNQVNFDSVEVKPAAGYTYLFNNDKPVRKLPIVTASYKK